MSVCIQKVKNPFQIELTCYYFIQKPSLHLVDDLGFRICHSLSSFLLPGLVKGKTGKQKPNVGMAQDVWNPKAWWKRRLRRMVVIRLRPFCRYWRFGSSPAPIISTEKQEPVLRSICTYSRTQF